MVFVSINLQIDIKPKSTDQSVDHSVTAIPYKGNLVNKKKCVNTLSTTKCTHVFLMKNVLFSYT